MHRFLVLVVVLTAAGVAPGQTPPAWQSRGSSSPWTVTVLIANQSVVDELKVSAEQQKELEKVVENVRTRYKEVLVPLEARRSELVKEMVDLRKLGEEGLAVEVRKVAKKLLPEAKFERYQQMERQAQGVKVLRDEEVVKTMALKEEQRTALDKVIAEETNAVRKVGNLTRGTPTQVKAKKAELDKACDDAEKNAGEILDEGQKDIWKRLVGAPSPAAREYRCSAPRGGFGTRVEEKTLLNDRKVVEELELDGVLAARVRLEADRMVKDLADRKTKQRAEQEKNRDDLAAVAKSMNDEVSQGVVGVLKEGQVTRLEQVRRQMLGDLALDLPEVKAALALTAEQDKALQETRKAARRSQLEETVAAQTKAIEEAKGDPVKGQEILVRLIQERDRKYLEMVARDWSEDQKKVWKELLGETFFLKMALRGEEP